MRRTKRLEATAYHEAGHVVMCWRGDKPLQAALAEVHIKVDDEAHEQHPTQQ